ncbi:hypothetical protein [Streptacidiphilus sp. PAMC 29251]
MGIDVWFRWLFGWATVVGGGLGHYQRMADDVVPSPEEVAAAQTEAGGWSRAQLKQWGIPWPAPRGWRRYLEAKWRGEDVVLIRPDQDPNQDSLF